MRKGCREDRRGISILPSHIEEETAKVASNSIVEKIIPAAAKSVLAKGLIRPPYTRSHVKNYDRVELKYLKDSPSVNDFDAPSHLF